MIYNNVPAICPVAKTYETQNDNKAQYTSSSIISYWPTCDVEKPRNKTPKPNKTAKQADNQCLLASNDHQQANHMINNDNTRSIVWSWPVCDVENPRTDTPNTYNTSKNKDRQLSPKQNTTCVNDNLSTNTNQQSTLRKVNNAHIVDWPCCSDIEKPRLDEHDVDWPCYIDIEKPRLDAQIVDWPCCSDIEKPRLDA